MPCDLLLRLDFLLLLALKSITNLDARRIKLYQRLLQMIELDFTSLKRSHSLKISLFQVRLSFSDFCNFSSMVFVLSCELLDLGVKSNSGVILAILELLSDFSDEGTSIDCL